LLATRIAPVEQSAADSGPATGLVTPAVEVDIAHDRAVADDEDEISDRTFTLTNINAAEQIVTYSDDLLRLLLAYLLLFSGLENSNKYAAGMGYSARRERRPSSSVHNTVGSLSPNFSNHSLMSGSSASHSS
jgi:hypothetical protein